MKLFTLAVVYGTARAQDQVYHLDAGTPDCFETNYTDPWYKLQGYVSGPCPARFDILDSTCVTRVCDQHSHDLDAGVGCSTKVMYIRETKKSVDDPLAAKEQLYHEDSPPNCFETNYTDSWYAQQGFVPGPCEPHYDVVDSSFVDHVCYQHSHDYDPGPDCPTHIVPVRHTKKGTDEPVTEKFYHQVSLPNCFEVNYTDSWYVQQNFTDGPCDPHFDLIDSTTIDHVCDQHSHDIDPGPDCPTDIVTVQHTKKGTDETSAAAFLRGRD